MERLELLQEVGAGRRVAAGQVVAHEVASLPERRGGLQVGDGALGADDEPRHGQGEPPLVRLARLGLRRLPGPEPVADRVGGLGQGAHDLDERRLPGLSRPSGRRPASTRRSSASALSEAARASSWRIPSRTSARTAAETPSIGNAFSRAATSRGCCALRRTAISSRSWAASSSTTEARAVAIVSRSSGNSRATASSSRLASAYHSAWIRNRATRSRSFWSLRSTRASSASTTSRGTWLVASWPVQNPSTPRSLTRCGPSSLIACSMRTGSFDRGPT